MVSSTATFPNNMISFLFVIVSVLVQISSACSPPEGGYVEPTLSHKVYLSDVVVLGRALQKVKDNNFPSDNVYSVQFEVRCIFKGAPLDTRIRINQVGEVPGLCISTQLELNKDYLVYLRREATGAYTPVEQENLGNEEYIEEIVYTCGVKVNYPKGDATSSRYTCPASNADEEDCFPVTPKPTTEGTPPPMPPTFKPPPMGSDTEKVAPPMPPTSESDTSPPAGPVKPEKGASYESVVENKEGDDGELKGNKDAGDKDGANSVTFTFATLTLTFIISIYTF